VQTSAAGTPVNHRFIASDRDRPTQGACSTEYRFSEKTLLYGDGGAASANDVGILRGAAHSDSALGAISVSGTSSIPLA
jgi:hypothetical protein